MIYCGITRIIKFLNKSWLRIFISQQQKIEHESERECREPVMWFKSDINFTRKKREEIRDLHRSRYGSPWRKKMLITFKLASLLLLMPAFFVACLFVYTNNAELVNIPFLTFRLFAYEKWCTEDCTRLRSHTVQAVYGLSTITISAPTTTSNINSLNCKLL